MSPGCFKAVLKFQGCFKVDSRTFQGNFEGDVRMFQASFKEVSGLCKEHFKGV